MRLHTLQSLAKLQGRNASVSNYSFVLSNMMALTDPNTVELFTILLRPPIGFKEQNPARAEKMRAKFIAQLLN